MIIGVIIAADDRNKKRQLNGPIALKYLDEPLFSARRCQPSAVNFHLVTIGSNMTNEPNSVELATELTIAWLSNPNTRTSSDDVPAFLQSMHAAVEKLGGSQANEVPEEAAQDYTPAVTVRKSLASKDHIISMIDGRPYKTLRRHLSTNGMTPEEYRTRYNLKADYPMVAEAYSEARRAMAKTIGLGRKMGNKVEGGAETVATKAKRGGKAALDAAKEALGTAE